MEKRHDDKGVQTMKSEMLASLKRRFSDTEKNECLVIATLLDPHFKDKFFIGPSERAAVRQMLEKKKEELGEAGRSLAAQEPSPKRPCTNLWKSFSEILEEAGASTTDFRSEVDIYTSLHELACNIASYCTSGRGIFTSRRRVKMQPTSAIIAICMLTRVIKCLLSIPEQRLVSSHTKYQVTRRSNASILIKVHRGC